MKSRIKKGLITYTLLSIALYNVSCQCLKHRKNSYAEGKYQMICLTTIDDMCLIGRFPGIIIQKIRRLLKTNL